MMAVARLGKFNARNSMVLLCDMQEKFRNNIQFFPAIINVSHRILQAAKAVDAPVLCTEQYPKGLGRTVPELGIEAAGVKPIEKTQFSMCVPPLNEALAQHKEAKNIFLCGIEAHVCIQHTALDLLEKGYNVHLVVDGVSSRSMTDRMYAFQRLRDVGAFLTTSESVILGLVGDAKHPKFREVQKIIWESAPDTGLLSTE